MRTQRYVEAERGHVVSVASVKPDGWVLLHVHVNGEPVTTTLLGGGAVDELIADLLKHRAVVRGDVDGSCARCRGTGEQRTVAGVDTDDPCHACGGQGQ